MSPPVYYQWHALIEAKGKAAKLNNDPDYDYLIHGLLELVQRKHEKTFVHGRFLRPTTAVSRSRGQAGEGGRRQKRVTFFCLPFFTMESLRSYKTDKHSLGYPVRALMQSVYRLESTRQRDATQIASRVSDNQEVVHVPELWALVIGKRKTAHNAVLF